MPETYFRGLEFKTHRDAIIRFGTPMPVPKQSISKPEVVKLSDFVGDIDGGMEIEEENAGWCERQIQRELRTELTKLNQQIGHPRLTMRGKSLHFVTPEEMKPKTVEERMRLIARYGDNLKDGGVGDCQRNTDGTYIMRVGYAGLENITSAIEVLQIAAHEFGHTLGVQLEPTPEELKAYTFANLFMRLYYGVDEYRTFPLDPSSGIHSAALFQLEQLQDRRISEEAILAHLTGQKFGNSLPNDYLKKL